MSLVWFRNVRKEDFEDLQQEFPAAVSGIPKENAGMTTTQMIQMDIVGVYFPDKTSTTKETPHV